MIFKCPICKRFHAVRPYDKRDYICDNASSQHKEFQDMEKNIFTLNNWNFNKFSTKEDVYRDVTIINPNVLPEHNRYHGGNVKNW